MGQQEVPALVRVHAIEAQDVATLCIWEIPDIREDSFATSRHGPGDFAGGLQALVNRAPYAPRCQDVLAHIRKARHQYRGSGILKPANQFIEFPFECRWIEIGTHEVVHADKCSGEIRAKPQGCGQLVRHDFARTKTSLSEVDELEVSIKGGEAVGQPPCPPSQAATPDRVANAFRETVAEGDESGPTHRLGIVSQPPS